MNDSQVSNVSPDLKLIGAGSAFRKELGQMVERAQFFNDWEWRDVEKLVRFVQAYEADAETVIFKEGQKGEFMCLLLEGKVDVLKSDSENQNRFIGRLGPGKTFGEMAIIDGELRSATCVCAELCKIAILTRGNFDKLLLEYPMISAKLVMKIATIISRRLRQASGKLVDFLED
jgi:CRP/FNR family transcriptional regulator, cyclic AMP receptor protein